VSSVATNLKRKEQTVNAVVTRADGTVIDMGVIAYYHRNPLKRLLGQLWVYLNRRRLKKLHGV
jgi:hypothetical protein